MTYEGLRARSAAHPKQRHCLLVETHVGFMLEEHAARRRAEFSEFGTSCLERELAESRDANGGKTAIGEKLNIELEFERCIKDYDGLTRQRGRCAPSYSKLDCAQVLTLLMNTVIYPRIVMPLAAGLKSQDFGDDFLCVD